MSDTEATPTTETEVPAETPEEVADLAEPQEEEAAKEADPAEVEEILEEEDLEEEEEEDELTVDLDALPKMKVSELKDILKALDLPTSGIKTTLIERIQLHFAEEDKQEEEDEVEEVEAEVEEAEVEEADAEESELLKENQPAAEYIEVKKTEETTAEPEKELTDDDKKKARAEKFGLQTDDEKKEVRAAKFGIDTDTAVEAKKEQRAAKFGVAAVTKTAGADKKAERAARFGNGTTTTTTSPSNNKLSVSSEDKTVETEKMKKRAARFNLDSQPAAKAVKLDDISDKLKEKIEAGSTKVDLSAAGLSLEEKRKLRALKFGA